MTVRARIARLSALLALAAGAAGTLFAGGGTALAAAGDWVDHEQSRVRLISAAESVPAGANSLAAGLQFHLEPGWKIYWRSPGDAGFPPSVDWTGSENLASASFDWPLPHRFSLFGLETFGYGGEVVLPLAVTPERPGEALRLRGQVSYLVCEEICIPREASLALDLPAGEGGAGPEAGLIERFQAQVPGDGSAAGLTLEGAALEGDPVAPGSEAEPPALEIRLASTQPLQDPDAIVEGPPGFSFGKPAVSLADDGRAARLLVPAFRGPQAEGALEGKRLTLTVFDGDRGLEQEVVARYADPGVGVAGLGLGRTGALAGGESLPLLVVLGLAVLGGLILNLMPCVLPVLSLKLLSAVGHGGRERGEVRLGFLASAAGILFSFLVLAGLAIGLKEAGLAAGWGIQFQQPLFLAAMALLVSLFAWNLFGLFEIRLPGFLADAALKGSGRYEAHGSSLAGHFLTGAFATLLATPCSAPFLGTAVGFALARGAPEILLVFACLGLGLALPYLLVALFPGLATSLPRPGPWMVTLRRLLALVLLATAAWLLSVLAVQAGWTLAIVLGALLLLGGLLLFLAGRLPRPLWLGGLLASALAVLILPALPGLGERPAAAPAVAEGDWRPLDRAEIDRLVAEGRTVFVDVTADWCITCQVNKALVLDRDPVAARLAAAIEAGDLVAMRGDWTSPDPEISDYLASFGRYGIPFNAVYGPGAPQGEALPELLTESAVLGALASASGPAGSAPGGAGLSAGRSLD